MPELPEVETVRRGLFGGVVEKVICSVEVRRADVIFPGKDEFVRSLEGKKFSSLERIGKLLSFSVQGESEQFLLVHLKMTGRLVYVAGEKQFVGGYSLAPMALRTPAGAHEKHTHVVFSFEDDSKLFFSDIRRFGYMRLVDGVGKKRIFSGFGMDPLRDGFSEQRFLEIFSGRKMILKAFLLAQNLIAGIGNIYADEICFAAGVRPGRRVSALRVREKKDLYAACVRVLTQAVEKGGTTFRDFVNGEGYRGNFLPFLRVYGRGGKGCFVCKEALVSKRIAGRTTVYCRMCQK